MVRRKEMVRYRGKDDEILFHVLAFLAVLIYFYGQKLENSSDRHDFILKPGLKLRVWSPLSRVSKLPILITNREDENLKQRTISNCDSIVVIIDDVFHYFNSKSHLAFNQGLVQNWISQNIMMFGGDLTRIKFLM